MRRVHLLILFTAIFLGLSISASAEIKTKDVEYRQGNTVLEGYLAYD